mgnify:CR=1 FL=1
MTITSRCSQYASCFFVDVLNALAFAAEAEEGGTAYRISKNGE